MHDMIVLRNVILYIVSLPLIELPSLFDGGVNRVHLVKLTGFISRIRCFSEENKLRA